MDGGERGECFPLMCASVKGDDVYIFREVMSEWTNKDLGTCSNVPNQVRAQPLFSFILYLTCLFV